ncbi:hypothetical protein QFZ67_007718 [Streptomyces sp. V1I1]|nr:hypothetical protein [Streptomyces sp. V1I1]
MRVGEAVTALQWCLFVAGCLLATCVFFSAVTVFLVVTEPEDVKTGLLTRLMWFVILELSVGSVGYGTYAVVTGGPLSTVEATQFVVAMVFAAATLMIGAPGGVLVLLSYRGGMTASAPGVGQAAGRPGVLWGNQVWREAESTTRCSSAPVPLTISGATGVAPSLDRAMAAQARATRSPSAFGALWGQGPTAGSGTGLLIPHRKRRSQTHLSPQQEAENTVGSGPCGTRPVPAEELEDPAGLPSQGARRSPGHARHRPAIQPGSQRITHAPYGTTSRIGGPYRAPRNAIALR